MFFAFQNLFRWLNWVLALILLLLHLTPKVPLVIDVAAYASVFIYNLFLTLKAAKVEQWLKKYPVILVLFDILFCTVILTAYGWRSPFTVYAFSPVVLAAYHNKIWLSFLAATLGGSGYLLSVALNGYTWAELNRTGWLDSHLVQFADFYFVALFFAYPAVLADRLRKANQALQESQTQLRELTLAQERQRIAEDIHDGVVQQIYGLRLMLEAALRQVSTDTHLSSQLLKAKNIAIKAAADLRAFIDDLFQGDMAFLSLGQLASKIINEYAGTYGLTIELDLKDYEKKLTVEAKKTVYLILQELLTNIVKHAQASKAKVVLECLAEKLFLSVTDNGVGFSSKNNEGHGLKIIAQRVQELQGTWQINSQTGKGTNVTIVIPLNQPAAKQSSDKAGTDLNKLTH